MNPLVFGIHEGVILSMARAKVSIDGVRTDDSCEFLEGEVEEIPKPPSGSTVAGWEHFACSSGRLPMYSYGQIPVPLSAGTVGGLAFNAGRNQLAVAHYGGVTIWTRRGIKWTKSVLIYKGFHASVMFSPNGKFVVSTMQENAVHGWRLSDNADFSMSPYPAKIKSIAWAGNTPYLVTSGASEAVC